MVERVAIRICDGDGAVLNRHRYVAYLIFEVILGWEVVWPADEDAWSTHPLKVQYGGFDIHRLGAAFIPAAGLLSEDVDSWIWSDAVGPGVPGTGRLPFGVKNTDTGRVDADWWSWVFWMATRWEERELAGDALDGFGRVQATSCLALQEGWLKRPEVEVRVRAWAESIGKQATGRNYRVLPTIDVDSAYAYLHRRPFRVLGAAAKDALHGDGQRWNERWTVLRGRMSDPYDTYDWLEGLHRRYDLKARYFFLLASRGKYDRGLQWDVPGLRQLIQRIQRNADIGIHPGVAAHEASTSDCMREEVERLQQVCGEPVIHSRQHYLLQRIDASWKRLESIGIRHDHSLGFADSTGFRAGISRPFRAYDVRGDRIMELTLHPVAVMDATLHRYMGMTPEKAIEHVKTIADEVRTVEGDMTLLWHNETVSNHGEWSGWKAVYEQLFEHLC